MNAPHLSELKYELYRCTGFGVCKGNYKPTVSPCPMTLGSAGFEAETPRGIMTMGRDILEGAVDYSHELSQMLYKCTMCGNCRNLCGALDLTTFAPLFDPGEVGLAMRRDLVERGTVPQPVRNLLESYQKRGNPFKTSQKHRGRWAEGTGIAEFKAQEYLLYVGCVGAFDEYGVRIARATARLLGAAGVSFGILGSREGCDGNEVNKLGERWLFEELAEKNIATFNEAGVDKIVTFTPHAYNAFKNDYPALNGNFAVTHSAQLFAELLEKKKFRPMAEKTRRVTFHDPCLLGRQNGEYDAPRAVLAGVPGLELVEMPRNRENALCCGGGGGNFFTDMVGSGPDSPARQRVREAAETGAEILAVACPTCAAMFNAAVKSEWLEDKLEIKDISEIVCDAMDLPGAAG